MTPALLASCVAVDAFFDVLSSSTFNDHQYFVFCAPLINFTFINAIARFVRAVRLDIHEKGKSVYMCGKC